MIGDDVSTALPAMRDMAESLMVDSGELRRPDTRVLNNTTAQYEMTPGELVYAGKARIQTTDTIGQGRDAADRSVAVTRFEVHLPMSAPQAEVDFIWTTTQAAFDPQLVGKRLRVASLVHKTFMTARRLAVEELQS